MEHPFSGPFSVTHPILSGSRDGPLAGSPGETIPSERDKVSVKRQPEKRASSFAAFSQTKECSKEIQMNFYSFEWLQFYSFSAPWLTFSQLRDSLHHVRCSCTEQYHTGLLKFAATSYVGRVTRHRDLRLHKAEERDKR